MSRDRRLSRRSFVKLVTGGAVAGSFGLVTGASAAELQGCSDSDPIGAGGDPGGRGRRCASRPQTGCSDTDSGTGGDPGGRGRRCNTAVYSGCSDSDSGAGSDPSGSGRRCEARCSDSDRGSGADPVGRGRRCGATGTGRGSGGAEVGAASTVPCTQCSCPDYVPTPGNQFARCARETCGHSAGSHAGASECRPGYC